MRTEAGKMPESTISAIGNAPASLMTDLGLLLPVRPCRGIGGMGISMVLLWMFRQALSGFLRGFEVVKQGLFM